MCDFCQPFDGAFQVVLGGGDGEAHVAFTALAEGDARCACDLGFVEQGIGQLISSLVKAGHKNFLVISGPEYSDVANERRNIALRQLKNHGFDDVPVMFGNFSYESGKECFARWMVANAAPDAVICSNDMMAIGCIDEARKRFGLLVPEQMSVVGFDGIYSADWDSYDLTTIRQPVNQMAKAAVDILVERIENPGTAPEKRVLAGEFRKGRSARV